MAKKNMKPNGKHLKEEDRAFIAECLQAGITFKEKSCQEAFICPPADQGQHCSHGCVILLSCLLDVYNDYIGGAAK